ncbi:hypothetical protein [Haloarchaeobius sp. DFWS5]|uniref:hypothetical protein n=1 Tax=Haloarchaeobius sp. DFWS5 TaxID=3446114 RepID=UPI003EBAD40D
MSDDDRRIGMSRLRYGFIGTVGLSGALVALQAKASLAYIAAGFVGGALAGLVLWVYLARMFKQGSSRGDRGGGGGKRGGRF